MRPALIERMVHRCYRRMIEAEDFGIRMHWWHRMAYHIRQRSPERIREMERAMGLN